MGSKLAFPTRRDSATFWDNGTEDPSLSQDKGTTGQAKKLAKIRDGARDKMRQSKKGRSKIGIGCFKTEKDVLKRERMF